MAHSVSSWRWHPNLGPQIYGELCTGPRRVYNARVVYNIRGRARDRDDDNGSGDRGEKYTSRAVMAARE